MVDLYSIVPGIQPTQQELIEAELLAKQILETKFPNMDLREGTGVRDLVLRPTSTLLAMIKKAVDYHFSQNTLSNVDDTSPSDIVDGILANSFIARRIGSKSTISARLFFARTKNVSVSASSYFSTDNKVKFFPTSTITYSASSLLYDPSSNEYYIDVEMTAEKEGSEYDISSGSLLYFSNFDPYFLRAEINYLILASQPTETNTKFIARAKNAVSTRNLINTPSIDFNLRDSFNFLNNILSVGMGDVEMLRDLVRAVLPVTATKQITAIVVVSTTATCTLPLHGYHTGQMIRLYGASSVAFNNDFLITVVDVNTFTIVVPGGTTTPGTLPLTRNSDIPVNIHSGGCVDIYCGESFSSGIVQVTTDATGKATVSGPVVALSRSITSGGSGPDSVPIQNSISVPFSSITLSAPNFTPGYSLCTLSTGTHPFINGEAISIVGTIETLAVSAISCSGVTVTATSNGHGYSQGDTVVISGATPTAYNGTYTIATVATNTFTYTVLANIASVGSGTMKCEVNVINGARTVYSSTGTSISILVKNTIATTAGTAVITSPVRYSLVNTYLQGSKIYNTTKDISGSIIVNLPKHSFSAGMRVTLSGYTLTGYNGNFVIQSVIDQDNFLAYTPLMLTNLTAIVMSGNEVCTTVIPSKDFGFSTKQSVTIDFGTTYPNSTASFTTKYFQYMDSLQPYLEAASRRVLCGDYLARGYNVYSLDIIVTYYTVSTASTLAAATTYIKSLSPGSPFVVAELASNLRVAGLNDIKFPLNITYTKYNRYLDYLMVADTGTITDVLDPNDRTTIFVLNSISTTLETLPVVSTPLQR